MKLFAFLAAMTIASAAFAQSKKELQAQVKASAETNKSLQAQIDLLKSEIEMLKKPKEVNLSDVHRKASYGLGVLMASNVIKQGGDSLNLEAMNAGIADVFTKTQPKINEQECTMIVQQYMQQTMERKAGKVKEECRLFLNENKTKPGVKTTTSGLQYQVISKGTGKSPKATSSVTVHYRGQLIDGSEFDSSIGGDPATFAVNQVIPGWTEALQLMHEGDKWMLFVPAELAYGDRGAGAEIPPGSALVFEVELIKVN